MNTEKTLQDEELHLWQDADKVPLVFEETPEGTVQKVINIDKNIFVATSKQFLYYGEVTQPLKKSEFRAIDIAVNTKNLFVVNQEGHVLKLNPQSLTVEDEIILREENGCEVKVSVAKFNETSALFITDSGQLWASGDQSQINVKSDQPKKVIFFDGRIVLDVACGADFYVALVRRIVKNENETESFVPEADTSVDLLNTSDSSFKTASTLAENDLTFEGIETPLRNVIPLSRDVNSDLSENFEELELGESEKIVIDSLQKVLSEELLCSTSTLSSENEITQNNLSSGANLLIQTGKNALSTELWTWGDSKYGQLGVGDIINRSVPRELLKLKHCGVRKIACGAYHTLALTLDGRVFAWGRNNFMQVSHCSQIDQKSPQLFASNFFIHLQSNERAKDVAAGSYHSLIMMEKNVYLVGKLRSSGVMSKLELPDIGDRILKRVLCSDSFSCCTTTISHSASEVSEILINEQIFLDEMLSIYQNLIIPFQKKSSVSRELNAYETLCQYYGDFLSATALYVQSLWKFYDGEIEIFEIIIIASADEFLAIYKRYLNAVCDIIALGGFTQIAKLVDIRESLRDLVKIKEKTDGKDLVSFVLLKPITDFGRYLQCVEKSKEVLSKFEHVKKLQEKKLKDAENTRDFWEGSGKIVEQFRSPERRIVRDSRNHPLTLHNAGRFSSHWFILFTDIFIHINNTSYTAHPIGLMWTDLVQDGEQNAFTITMPEQTSLLLTPSASERGEWFHTLQNAIKHSLQKSSHLKPPQLRTGSFTFVKHSSYKDAIYSGQWLNGKLHGSGKLEWADNRLYVGQFYKGAICGAGRMEMPSQGIYEGQWRDGLQNGFGTMNYLNGDAYEGYFKDGLPHGHGMKKEGHFMASVATVYIGEWSCGVKEGYGVSDDIKTGEKYLGSWHNNMKHGNGLIVTTEGIYYEGTFVQDVFQGHGIMVLEDGMHYEGEFKSIGTFGGKGMLTFSNKEVLEGNFSGVWSDGIKVNATLRIYNHKSPERIDGPEPKSFQTLCCQPDQKWRAIFRQFYLNLGLPDPDLKSQTPTRKFNSKKLWHNVAAIISKSQRSRQKKFYDAFGLLIKYKKDEARDDQLNKILYFSEENLTLSAYIQIQTYLTRAFESPHHPLGILLTELANVYTATYGGVRVHPLLLRHAVAELRSITSRIYEIVTLFFHQLPKIDDESVLKSEDGNEETVISGAVILHPILLPRVYSALFFLYALHNKKSDDAYWQRLIKWNKQPNNTLLAFLGVDKKFWENVPNLDEKIFLNDAIEMLQQLKNTFSAVDKLVVVRNTHNKIESAIQIQLEDYKLTADELIPLFYFIVIRASILQLGSEIHFIRDFMEPYLMNGQYGYAFTTLMGIYDHILNEKISMDM